MQIQDYIDHTLLKPGCTVEAFNKLCAEAAENKFAAVCVPPIFVPLAVQNLKDTGVKTATVIGFPFGYSAIEAKVAEIVLAILHGADELDVVINYTAIKNGDWQYIANEINTIMPILKKQNKCIKVIIESGELTNDEIIKCCDIYGAAGVDFMKTSTGYSTTGATIEAVQLMRTHLSNAVQIKASGGIRNYAFAKQLIDAGATRIGCSASLNIVNEANQIS
jgi:deoxyribose-phosphate aldolase